MMNHDLNYSISFSDNFSGALEQFGGAVSELINHAQNLNASFEAVNPELKEFKKNLSSKNALSSINTKLNTFEGSIKRLTNATTGLPRLNQQLSELFRKLGAYDDIAKVGLDKAALGFENLDKALDKHDANIDQSIAKTNKQTEALRNQAAVLKEVRSGYAYMPTGRGPRTSGGGGMGGGGRFEQGRRLRQVGQGMYQSGMATMFGLLPAMGLAGAGMQYNQDIDKMMTGAKLRSSDIQDSPQLQKELKDYLRDTFKNSPYKRDTADAILAQLGAYGVSFKSEKGTFKGSAADSFFQLNLRANKALDLSPEQLAKYQSFVMASGREDLKKQGKALSTENLVNYTSDKFKYINYIADTYGVTENDLVKSVNTKMRAATKVGTSNFTKGVEEDSVALAAYFQRGTGKSPSQAASVGASILSRLTERAFLLGTDKQPGVLNNDQANDLQTVIREQGKLKGMQAFAKLANANKQAAFSDLLAKGVVKLNADGSVSATDKATEKDKASISQTEADYKARLKKTLGRYGDQAIDMFSPQNLTLLNTMIGANQSDIDRKGIDKVDKIFSSSLIGKFEAFKGASSDLAGSIMSVLEPALVFSLETLTGLFNRLSDFIRSHPVIAGAIGAGGLAAVGGSAAMVAGGVGLNIAGTAMQGYAGLGEIRQMRKQKKMSDIATLAQYGNLRGYGKDGRSSKSRALNIARIRDKKIIGNSPIGRVGKGAMNLGRSGIGHLSKGASAVGKVAGGAGRGIAAMAGTFGKVAGLSAIPQIFTQLGSALGPIIQMASRLLFTLNPISIGIGLVVGAGALWLSQFTEVRNTMTSVGELVGNTFNLIGVSISSFVTDVVLNLQLKFAEFKNSAIGSQIFKENGGSQDDIINVGAAKIGDKVRGLSNDAAVRAKQIEEASEARNLSTMLKIAIENGNVEAQATIRSKMEDFANVFFKPSGGPGIGAAKTWAFPEHLKGVEAEFRANAQNLAATSGKADEAIAEYNAIVTSGASELDIQNNLEKAARQRAIAAINDSANQFEILVGKIKNIKVEGPKMPQSKGPNTV